MLKNNTRRAFLKTTGLGLVTVPVAASLMSAMIMDTDKNLSNTKQAVQVPPKLSLNVMDNGAKADGVTIDTAAIQQTIDRCGILGGGEVFFPAGNYATGAIQIRSNVTLKLDAGAIISGTSNYADYPVTQVRWEGKWIPGHIGLVYAIDAVNIGITGTGKIMGNHALSGRPSTQDPLRHPALIEPINCKGMLFEGFSTDYYSMWSLHPTFCEDIVIKNLTIRSTGGNGDGIDVDSCKHVVIDNCDIATGDDCISLKSGRGMEGYSLLRTTEDVHISNCTFADSIFACIGIGSETSGGIRNVRIEKCRFIKAKSYAIYIKSQPGRGAFIEDITVNDIDVSGTTGGFLRFNLMGSGLQDQVPIPGPEGIPTVKNFKFSNIRVTNVPVLVEGTGVHPDKPLDGFLLSNVSGTCGKGISLANIKNAKIENINVTGFSGALLGINNVTGIGLEGAAAINPPKVPAAIPAPAQPYQLK